MCDESSGPKKKNQKTAPLFQKPNKQTKPKDKILKGKKISVGKTSV